MYSLNPLDKAKVPSNPTEYNTGHGEESVTDSTCSSMILVMSFRSTDGLVPDFNCSMTSALICSIITTPDFFSRERYIESMDRRQVREIFESIDRRQVERTFSSRINNMYAITFDENDHQGTSLYTIQQVIKLCQAFYNLMKDYNHVWDQLNNEGIVAKKQRRLNKYKTTIGHQVTKRWLWLTNYLDCHIRSKCDTVACTVIPELTLIIDGEKVSVSHLFYRERDRFTDSDMTDITITNPANPTREDVCTIIDLSKKTRELLDLYNTFTCAQSPTLFTQKLCDLETYLIGLYSWTIE